MQYKVIMNLKASTSEEGIKTNYYEELFEFKSPMWINEGDWINRVDFDVSISKSYGRPHEKAYGGYGNMYLYVRDRIVQPDKILLVVEEKSLTD